MITIFITALYVKSVDSYIKFPLNKIYQYSRMSVEALIERIGINKFEQFYCTGSSRRSRASGAIPWQKSF